MAEKAVSIRVVLLVAPALQCLIGGLLTRLRRLNVARVLREVALLPLGGFSCACLALRVRGVDLDDRDLLGAALGVVGVLLHDGGRDGAVRWRWGGFCFFSI